jgi:lipoprotein-releasing system ATP-binding protein
MSMAPILQAKSVHKTYRLGRVDVPVLHGVDLAVEKGQCVAVLGASGSGKSTLLHLLGGLDRPDDSPQATITFDGKDITRAGVRELDQYRGRRVGFVFQFYHLLPELTVLENTLISPMVSLGRFGYAKQSGALKARAAELLDTMGLAHRLKHRPVELSGGERQRVAIARALMNEPALLLADEPTGNLDQATGASILDALMEVRTRLDQTMVLVTHDTATAERADRVVRLADGVFVDPD